MLTRGDLWCAALLHIGNVVFVANFPDGDLLLLEPRFFVRCVHGAARTVFSQGRDSDHLGVNYFSGTLDPSLVACGEALGICV
jgi:hypothetical protein